MTAINKPSYHLNERHFALACAAALILHSIVVAAWLIAPGERVREVPVRVLNIKLGDGEDIEVSPAAAPPNTPPVEHALTQHFEATPEAPPPAPRAPTQAVKTPVAPPNPKLSAALNQVAQQFVRPKNNDYTTSGSTLGNSATGNAEAIRRYEQLVSSWYWKYHFYPEEARQQKLQSNGVVRVEYDRQGNLRSYAVEKSTGYTMLDRAMLETANRANPFPPVPDNYKPGSAVVAFTIQVTFTMNGRTAP